MLLCPAGHHVQDQQEGWYVCKEAPEWRLPPFGGSKGCFLSGSVCSGQLFGSRWGSPGQHLAWEAADEKRNRYVNKTITHSHVHLSSVTWTPLACPVCPVVGFNMWSVCVSAAEYMTTVTEFGCLPVSTMFCKDKERWVVVRSVSRRQLPQSVQSCQHHRAETVVLLFSFCSLLSLSSPELQPLWPLFHLLHTLTISTTSWFVTWWDKNKPY